MHVHSRSIVYFDKIRKAGSIRGAAKHLHVTSSAINRQLLQLEEEVGTPLFDRLPSGLQMTSAGEAFARHVITVLQDERRMLGELDMLRGIRRGEVNIAAIEGLNADLLPACLERMLTRYPMIRVRVASTGSDQTGLAVASGDADIAIGFSLARSDALRQCAVGSFGLGAIVRADHPLATAGKVTFAECANYPLILASPQLSIHAQMKPLLSNHKRALTVVLETASIELAKSMVTRGVGIAFQTRVGLEREIAQNQLVHVPLKAQIRLTTELGVYVRAGRTLPPAVDAFVQILAEEIDRRESAEQSGTAAATK